MRLSRVLPLLFIAAGACAGDDLADPDATSAEALTTPSWIHPACDADALVSPSGACDGPWTFGWKRTCSDPAICGYTDQCATHRSCANWPAGIVWSSRTENPSTQYTHTVKEKCTSGGGGSCQVVQETGPEPGPKCNAVAKDRKDGILLDPDPDPAGEPDDGEPSTSQLQDISTRLKVTGSFVTVSETESQTGSGSTYFLTTVHKYKCRLALTNVPSPNVGPGEVCACATYVPATCTCESGTTLTDPGVPVPTSPGAGRTFTSAPACTTCDQLPFAADPAARLDADVQAKFACLDQNLAGASGPLADALLAREQLVHLLAGDQLTDAQRARALDAYADDASPACQLPATEVVGCASDVDAARLSARLQLCQDLTLPVAGPDAVVAQVDGCIALIGEVATCRVDARRAAEQVARTLIERSFDGFTAADGLQPDLVTALRRIDAWWAGAALVGDPAETRRARAADLTDALYQAAHQARFPLPVEVGADAAAASLLADVSATGLETDWTLLAAAFDPSRPIDSPPLLQVVADALRGTSERLARVSPIHDAACRFADCKPAGQPARATPVTQAWRLLASTPTPAGLSAALAAAGLLDDPAHRGLLQGLAALRDRHGALAAAWAEIAGTTPLAALAGSGAVPPEAAALAAIVRAARAHEDAYASTGQLEAGKPRLSLGVLRRPELVGFLDRAIEAVERGVTDHEAARLETVNDLLAEVRSTSAIDSLLARLGVLALDVNTAIGDLGDLRARERSAGGALAGFTASFEALADSDVLDADAAFDARTLPPITVSGRDARLAPGASFDVAALTVATVTADPGELIRLSVLGQYAPTCALQQARLTTPEGVPGPITIPAGGAMTGPEGYYLQWSSEGYRASSVSDAYQTSTSHSESFQECFNANLFSWPPPVVDNAAMFGSLSQTYQECTSDSWGWSSSSTSTDGSGTQDRASISFAGGLRLPGTPFPDAPVGSLVAVTTVHGQPANILAVQVVGRQTVLTAPAVDPAIGSQVDIRFIVNDVRGFEAGLCVTPPADALTVEVTVVTPLGAVARAIATAMADTLAQLEAEAPSYYAGGTLLPDEKTLLRTSAWARVQQALIPTGLPLSNLPRPLRDLFDAWLEHELASIARRAELVRIGRGIERLHLEGVGLVQELAAAEAQGRLLALVPRWRLRALAAEELQADVRQLADALSTHAAPIFALRDPARRAQFRSDADGALDALLAIDFAGEPTAAIRAFELFAEDVRDTIAGAEFELPQTYRRTVAIAFPRVSARCDAPPCGPWREASPEAAAQAWAGATSSAGGHVASLRVRPADLYTMSGGNSWLSCHDVAPVVRRAALYVGTDDADDLGDLGREVFVQAGGDGTSMSFPGIGGVTELWPDDARGVPLPLPVDSGPEYTAVSELGSSPELGAGAGLSPFTTFRADLSSFYREQPLDMLSRADALVLVLEVERRVSNDLVSVPGVCQTDLPGVTP